MNEFPFPKLLAFLENEADQVEFMKVAAEVGLGASDLELAKLLVALQLYKSYYATIPRQIKSVHTAALGEMHRIRDEVNALAESTAADAFKIRQWAEEINHSILTVQPEAVANSLHKRLLEETLAALGGSIQAIAVAYGRIDAATAKLNTASAQAQTGIYEWQTITVRRVWLSAFLSCSVLAVTISVILWIVFFSH